MKWIRIIIPQAFRRYADVEKAIEDSFGENALLIEKGGYQVDDEECLLDFNELAEMIGFKENVHFEVLEEAFIPKGKKLEITEQELKEIRAKLAEMDAILDRLIAAALADEATENT